MGVYSSSSLINQVFSSDELQEIQEAFIYDEISRLPEEDRKTFCESEEAQALVEAGVLKKPTLVRLSKMDDLTRRIGMASLQMAKNNNDPLWNQLVKNREKEKDLLSKIKNKYSSKATKTAKMGQKDYIKSKGIKIPITFIKR